MKFCFELTNLTICDAVKIERLHVTTEYTVEEFIAMTSAYPALIEALVRVAADAPSSRTEVVN